MPIELRDANALVQRLHRHHQPVQGHRFSIGVEHDGKLCGAAIVGRPVARKTDQRRVVEVTRLVTDGTKNACSILYAAAARAAREMGYERIQTFILEHEAGVTLKAAGWTLDGTSPGRQWDHTNERQLRLGGGTRRDDQPTGPRQRWIKRLNTAHIRATHIRPAAPPTPREDAR